MTGPVVAGGRDEGLTVVNAARGAVVADTRPRCILVVHVAVTVAVRHWAAHSV